MALIVNDFENIVKYLKDNEVQIFKTPKDESFGRYTIIMDLNHHLIPVLQLKDKATYEGLTSWDLPVHNDLNSLSYYIIFFNY